MKPLSTISARSTWLFNIAEMNPSGIRLFPNLTDALTEQFDFDDQPENATTLMSNPPSNGLKFLNGEFKTDQGQIRVSLEVYDDGIIADCAVSTDVADQFIQHVIGWACTTFGLVFNPKFVARRIHMSDVVVELASDIFGQIKPLSSFSDLLSNASFNGAPQAFRPFSLKFANLTGQTQFTIERRANTPLQANVFYSRAETDTASHLQLIADFERLLIGRPKQER